MHNSCQGNVAGATLQHSVGMVTTCAPQYKERIGYIVHQDNASSPQIGLTKFYKWQTKHPSPPPHPPPLPPKTKLYLASTYNGSFLAA